jgi:hypothetical protein
LNRALPSLLYASCFAALACGPNSKPEEPCRGPSIHLSLRATGGPLPADTHITVRYGGNREGERYALGDGSGQAVFCEEDTSTGGAPSVPEPQAGATSDSEPLAVWQLECRLFTQGPARLDASATGYEPLEDEPLNLTEQQRCEVPIEKVLEPLLDPETEAD